MSERGPGQRGLALGLWFAVFACLAVSILPTVAPRVPTQDGPGAFSVDRALEHVEFIAREPHVMGTPEIERVREYLAMTLDRAGLEPETMTIEAPDYFGSTGGTVDVTNVFVRIRGTGDRGAILLMAHYDTVPTTSGANDNSAAVAALLEVARIVAIGTPTPNDVIILFTDGEEPQPRFGAWGFAEYHPWFDDVALAVNFEGIGVAGASMLVEISGPADELIVRLVDAVPDPVVFSFVTRTADLIGGTATDFDIFRDAGVPGYNFTYMRGTSIYHTPSDSIANLNVGGLSHHGTLALGIARNFGSLDLKKEDETKAVFFTVPPRHVVQYSGGVAIGSVVAALALVGGTIWTRISHRGSSVRRVLCGLWLVLTAGFAAVAVSTGVWIGLVRLRPHMGVAEGYVYLAALVGLTAIGWRIVQRRSAMRGIDHAGGLLVVWLAFALLVGVGLPAVGYLFVLPAIAAGIADMVAARSRKPFARIVAVTLVSLMTLIIVVPAVDVFFQFASPRPGNPGSQMPGTIAVSMVLVYLSVGLIATHMPIDRYGTT